MKSLAASGFGCWCAFVLWGGFSSAEAGDAPAESEVLVAVDREKVEIRLPCRFVSSTRQIEVFACHTRGPTHETVVEFDATGAQLYRALLQIGCRPTDHWNATSPSDFLRNQGDRVLVLVRWEWDGKTHELPAEAMLVDGQTGFSSFVRGFSFSGPGAVDGIDASQEAPRDTEGNEAQPPSPRGIPRVVEISLGATRRQRAVFSLLSHPTSLRGETVAPGGVRTRALQYWSFPPMVSPLVLPDLRRLVEEQPAATLIFRRLASELELIRYVRSIAALRGEERRLELYSRLEPLARTIDTLKTRYENDAKQIKDLLERDKTAYYGDSARELENRGEMLRRRGQWLCARIQELYFKLYGEQQKFEVEQLRLDKNLPADVFEQARAMSDDGLLYEVRIAAKETERAEGRLREFRLEQEIWSLELSREDRWCDVRVADSKARIAMLAPDQDYVKTLRVEELRGLEIEKQAVGFRRALCEALILEIDGFLAGTLDSQEEALSLRRQTAEAGLKIVKLESDLLAVDDSIRWNKGDLESEFPEIRDKARQKLPESRRRKAQLELAVKKARETLQELQSEGR